MVPYNWVTSDKKMKKKWNKNYLENVFQQFFSPELCLINGTNGSKTKKFGFAAISTIFL